MYKPVGNEVVFPIHPVGVKYICEFCNKGEMKLLPPPKEPPENLSLFPHQCNKCGKIMNLPQMYPKIEWVPENEEEKENESGGRSS